MLLIRSLLLFVLVTLLFGCAPPPDGPATRPDSDRFEIGPDETDGAALYRAYCASCHRPLAKTDKPNRPVSRIHSSIRHFGAMRHLDFLTIEQIQALAEVTKRP